MKGRQGRGKEAGKEVRRGEGRWKGGKEEGKRVERR